MEYSFIFIDGWALWVVLTLFVLWLAVFVIIGNAWIKAERELHKKEKQISKLRHGYNDLLGKYQQATFKLPDVETDLGGDGK